MAETAWALIPPAITILLALTTREVFVSLALGIFTGAAFYTDFRFLEAADVMFTIMDGMISEHTFVLIFLVLLGILVEEISCSGATRAYGCYAMRKARGKRGALFLTIALGIFIFIDDYFNCVTVGDAMRKVTDRFGVTRAKLAYIIDATAAPVCCIAPVSTWAAAVSSTMPTDDESIGFGLFLETVPLNFYAWLTLLFLAFLVWSGRDFLTMDAYEKAGEEIPEDDEEEAACGEGTLTDLFLPILVLLLACLAAILYTGGWQWGGNLKEAYDASDPARGLAIGTFLALLFTAVLYRVRHVMSYKQLTECISMGFVNMTSSIFVLCLAWTLAGVCGPDYLNLSGFLTGHTEAMPLLPPFFPALFFLAAFALSIVTGTSWGTFGILLPLALSLSGVENETRLVLCFAAILAGAVGGDHVSPLSSTTILASAGAGCRHVDHVNTQIPYVAVVALPTFAGYLAAGLAENGWAGLLVSVLTLAVLCLSLLRGKGKGKDIFKRVEMKEEE